MVPHEEIYSSLLSTIITQLKPPLILVVHFFKERRGLPVTEIKKPYT